MEVMKKLSEIKGFEIKVDDLFYAGMKIVEVIRKSYNEEKIKEKWEKLIESVTNPNQDEAVYIRSHGRNGASSDSMLILLENVFNRSFSIDKTNNSQPKKLLKEFCCDNYQDYQISHIFEERTNNPLLFTAPWMVCYTPKIIDPFTGQILNQGSLGVWFRDCAWDYTTNTMFGVSGSYLYSWDIENNTTTQG